MGLLVVTNLELPFLFLLATEESLDQFHWHGILKASWNGPVADTIIAMLLVLQEFLTEKIDFKEASNFCIKSLEGKQIEIAMQYCTDFFYQRTLKKH